MSQRLIDLAISVVACAAGFALSWPFSRNFEYWAESRVMWWLYFAVGYLMSVYVFVVFLGCVRTLFLHDALVKKGLYKKAAPATGENGDSP